MKKLLLISSFIFSFHFSFTQTFNSDCLCNTDIINIYRNDVYRLAYKRIIDLNSTYKDSVIIPALFADSILKKLALVYNMPVSPVRDSVISVFGNFDNAYYYVGGEDSTHVNGGIPSLKKFQMAVDQNAPWAAQWIAGNYTNTSNAQINALMSQYHLTASLQYTIPGTHIFWVLSKRNYNMLALKSRFEPIPYVENTYLAGAGYGDGAMINYGRNNNKTTLDYYFKCGDCPSGCTEAIKWSFEIPDATCVVEYKGDSGYVTPPPPFNDPSCEIFIPLGGYPAAQTNQQCTVQPFVQLKLGEQTEVRRIHNHEFGLFPNPALNKLAVSLPKGLAKEKLVAIYDITGRKVLEITNNQKTLILSVNTQSLAGGTYFLTISTYASYNTLKFTKQ